MLPDHKLLTNHLKQIVSYRSYNVMEETYLMNDVKERLCYVSLDFDGELALTRFKGKKNTLRREFVLPDYVTHHRGRIREPAAALEAQTLELRAPTFALHSFSVHQSSYEKNVVDSCISLIQLYL